MRQSVNPSIPWWRRRHAPLLLAVWFGLLAGLIDAGGRWLLLARDELPLYLVSSVYAPAAVLVDLGLFAAAGLVFWGLHGLRREVVSLRVAVLFLGFFFFLSAIAHISGYYLALHPLAALLLACGLAVQASRTAAAHPATVARVVRWTTPVLLLTAGLIAAGGFGRTARTGSGAFFRVGGDERLLEASRSATEKDSRPPPNVLLIVMDTVRAKSLSLYRYDRETTPNLESLARQGVLFEHAVAPAPWTLPTHASVFTGRYPFELSCDWCRPLDGTHPTLAEVLRDRGYETAAFVANFYYCGRHTGLDRGFEHFHGAELFSGEALRHSSLGRMISQSEHVQRLCGWYHLPGRKDAARINREFSTWLAEQNGERPFFAFLNYYDAHDPYVAGVSGFQEYASCCLNLSQREYTAEELARLRNAYDGCIRRIDEQIGRLVETLRRNGELENTLIVITSDHGEQFGEHGLIYHGNSLYRPLTHVPLLLVFPDRVPAGARVDGAASLRDLPATILDLVRLPPALMPGRSLASRWQDASPGEAAGGEPVLTELSRGIKQPDWFPNAHGGLRSIWMNGLQYIVRFDTGEEQLYDFLADPLEQNDLSESAGAASLLERFRRILEDYQPETGER